MLFSFLKFEFVFLKIKFIFIDTKTTLARLAQLKELCVTAAVARVVFIPRNSH